MATDPTPLPPEEEIEERRPRPLLLQSPPYRLGEGSKHEGEPVDPIAHLRNVEVF